MPEHHPERPTVDRRFNTVLGYVKTRNGDQFVPQIVIKPETIMMLTQTTDL